MKVGYKNVEESQQILEEQKEDHIQSMNYFVQQWDANIQSDMGLLEKLKKSTQSHTNRIIKAFIKDALKVDEEVVMGKDPYYDNQIITDNSPHNNSYIKQYPLKIESDEPPVNSTSEAEDFRWGIDDMKNFDKKSKDNEMDLPY